MFYIDIYVMLVRRRWFCSCEYSSHSTVLFCVKSSDYWPNVLQFFTLMVLTLVVIRFEIDEEYPTIKKLDYLGRLFKFKLINLFYSINLFSSISFHLCHITSIKLVSKFKFNFTMFFNVVGLFWYTHTHTYIYIYI